MENKRFWLGVLVLVFGMTVFTSCWSTGTARETLPQTAVTIQRVRVTDTLLGEVLGATNASLGTPMQIFIDHNEPLELANGASTTILINNGEHMVYAVLGNIESKSVRFTAKSQTISVNVSTKKPLIGRITLEIEVK
ncbi:MAG: hypothetical protein LBH43_05220 [Treponema sp.]|jgi:hypothetical protein|nr:hypothetical protein [Treponema sp.]